MTKATEHTQYVNTASVFVFFFSMINATLTLNYRGIVFYFIWLIKF